MNRREFAALVCLAPVCARAAAWPEKPMRIIVPYATGGAPDILGRLVAQELGQSLGPTLVENRAGAGGSVGAQYVSKSTPDGYTFLVTTTATHAINPALYVPKPYDPINDFTPLGMIATTPLMLAAGQGLGVGSLRELLELVRAQPGKFSYASAGVGTIQHMAGLLFEELAGVRMIHVPYKGTTQIIPDLVSGRVSIMFNSIAAFAPFVKDGRLRPLAMSSKERIPGWADVPTMSEAGFPSFTMSSWYAAYGPPGLPEVIVRRLNAELRRIVGLPSTVQTFASLGLEAAASTPRELLERTRDDLSIWTDIVRKKGVKME